jgi:hypothetical protein
MPDVPSHGPFHHICFSKALILVVPPSPPHTACTAQVRELLERIEAGGILPPLVVLQVLARHPGFQLSLVKDYVTRQLQADSRCAAGRMDVRGGCGAQAHSWQPAMHACLLPAFAGRLAVRQGREVNSCPRVCPHPCFLGVALLLFFVLLGLLMVSYCFEPPHCFPKRQ